MKLKWEIRRVSTLERIFNKIKEEMAQPVGIVLFGADGELKNKTLDAMTERLRGFADYHIDKTPSMDNLIWTLDRYSAVVVVLRSDESSTHGLRHKLVKMMRSAGAKTVVGIYAKASITPIKPTISSLKSVEHNKQIAAIEQSNPTANELDYFVVVDEEEER